MKIPIPQFLILVLTVWFGSLQSTHGVNPPPDGSYPLGNTAEGEDALFSLTANGAANTAIGAHALFFNTTGDDNTAVGFVALNFNTTGSKNTALGLHALFSNQTGRANTATGFDALNDTTSGIQNTATGFGALERNETGSQNTAIGYGALSSNTFGGGSTAVGYQALASQSGRGGSTAIGSRALASQTDGEANTATGAAALESTTGSRNTANGFTALRDSTGNDNTALGAGAGGNVTTASNVICIGAGVFGANVDNSCYIGNIFGSTSANGVGVLVNSNGRLGTMTSSARFKDDIKPMAKASEALFALTPVTFRYKKEIDPAGASQLGLVAEDVEKVNSDLVVRDKEGKPYTVRYDQVNAMLLNEFLKEHRKVETQEKKVQQLETTVTRLEAALKEQAAQIQKVNEKVELGKPAPRIVTND